MFGAGLLYEPANISISWWLDSTFLNVIVAISIGYIFVLAASAACIVLHPQHPKLLMIPIAG